jgi:hypothetical protein
VPAADVALAGSSAQRCAAIASLAHSLRGGGSLTAALAPQLVTIALGRARYPRYWGRAAGHVVMKRAGTLRARFSVPARGRWELWLRGELMPSIAVAVDGRPVGRVAGQLSGNSLITAPAPPLRVSLGAGEHTVSIHRSTPTFAPGDRGAAVLRSVFLTPASAPAAGRLLSVPSSAWPTLCKRPLRWVESYRR